MKIRVGIMFGGTSVEHEVSIISALQAMQSLDQDKYDATAIYLTKDRDLYIGPDIGNIEAYKDIPSLIRRSIRVIPIKENGHYMLAEYPHRFLGIKPVELDVILPVVHGTNVEDGTLMGYLKTWGIPFAGCDVTPAAVGMDKYIQKTVFADNDIPVLPCHRYTTGDYKDIDNMIKDIEEHLSYPVIVKPVNSGSSVGISVAHDRDGLTSSLDEAFTFANVILVEHAISDLQEINCSVLGDLDEAEASLCEEPFHSDEILSYEDKYMSGGKGSKNGGASKGMASVSRKIPAPISDELTERIRTLAVKAFQCLGCNGVVRFDFMIDKADGSLYLNEINTIPGSLSFYLWEPAGMPYGKLLDRLIELAMKRRRDEERVTFSFETNILSQSSLKGLKGGSKGGKA
ncbi:MAG: D-alanine--D-alanine ligase [Lachnospiraceae bacterium]|nr:D-alanine--D-alanine ligase [Lachnospiraceae bacterium]